VSRGSCQCNGLDDRTIEVRSPAEAKGFFLYPLRPDRLWGPPSLLNNGYRGVISPGLKSGRGIFLCCLLFFIAKRSLLSGQPSYMCVYIYGKTEGGNIFTTTRINIIHQRTAPKEICYSFQTQRPGAGENRVFCEISSSHGGEYDVQSCLLGYTAV
jgi:hypothetical protein